MIWFPIAWLAFCAALLVRDTLRVFRRRRAAERLRRDICSYMMFRRETDPAPKPQRNASPRHPHPEPRPTLQQWFNEVLDPEDRS